MTPADLIAGIRAMEQEIASLRAQVAALTAAPVTGSPVPGTFTDDEIESYIVRTNAGCVLELAKDVQRARGEVYRLRALLSTHSPAPTDSGAEPAREEGASARACWGCAHDSIGDGRGVCMRPFRGPHRYAVSRWILDNCTGEPLPTARNCPGWAAREAGEVSDG